MGENSILDDYSTRVKAAYSGLGDAVVQLHVLGIQGEEHTRAMRRLAGECGAACSAASKAAQAALIVRELLQSSAKGMDITPTLALRFSEKLLGRGVDMHQLLHSLATPGRTAANKTALSLDDPAMLALESRLSEEIGELNVNMAQIREQNRQAYRAKLAALGIA